jgi:CRP/FNR family transcriptional regulator
MSDIITHIKKYVGLNESEVQMLLGQIRPVQLTKKEYLLKEGQVCKSIYFVGQGCLRLFFINDKGSEQITQFAIEGWWIADYVSFDRETPSPFYIQAIEDSVIYPIDFLLQEKLTNEISSMEKYFRLMLQKALAASQLRIKFLFDLSREEGYRQFVSSFPGFVQRIPQYMLASYLNFTPEYLSELRKKIR